MIKPRLTIPESLDGFTARHTSGGFLFTRPDHEPIPEKTVSEAETEHLVKTYRAAQDTFPAENTYHAYLNLLPSGAAKTALRGLCEAVDMYRPTQEPVTIIVGEKHPRAVIANLYKQHGIESWYRKNDRGAHVFSAQIMLSKTMHPIVYGDSKGIIEIDRDKSPMRPDLPIDDMTYLPMIDGTTDYLAKHNGLRTIALGNAVRPELLEHGLGHLWDTFVAS